ncbi:CitMHS family transporter [Streptomyces zagrosensis]|uniref:CitMHS family citrate-Mg2+:H+ or citrate-Ca2+:H+ symporter n=1 Tax=Streptomyces zagrosensis TaxID=1042984 RepID=A0A7W9UZ26_9ACTN|nr:citrate:proton symporter [Streptomyces zagrosensis]MBB5936317.1 CitMHS family citrate-Mg2+:H+ or citrate-Ca2+:H+ symporter [Streptomyces zagrosensis]
MLTILGFVMIATFLVLIMMKKMSPLAALVLVPALFCVLVGKGAQLGDYVLDGIGALAPTAAMLMFAIIYFGVMIDVGLFDPIVRIILRFCKADPVRIVVGTAVLAAVVSLDGDGSTTFMITVSAMLPLYRRLKMSVLVMTCVAATANGVMNTVPWGGPTARAATALDLDAGDIFIPMIPALAVGLLFVFFLAYVLGRRERNRLGLLTLDDRDLTAESTQPELTRPEVDAGQPEQVLVTIGGADGSSRAEGAAVVSGVRGSGRVRLTKGPGAGSAGGGAASAASAVGDGSAAGAGVAAGADVAFGADEDPQTLDPNRATLRPKLYWFNAGLTVALLTLLILQTLPIPVLFLLGAAVALTVNFPHMPDQRARIAAHSENVLNVSGMVFAAAVFTGVLTGTGMVEHMARWLVDGIPDGLGPHMALVTGVLSIPLTYFMSNDGFYFGIVPILAEAGAAHGVSATEIARASLVGQSLHMSSPLVPAVYVLVGMAKVEFGDHTRFTVKWAALTALVVLGAGLLFGII